MYSLGDKGRVPRAGPRWPLDQPLQPDKLCCNQIPRGPQSRMQTGISPQRKPLPLVHPQPSVLASHLLYPGAAHPSDSLISITHSTIRRGSQKPKTFDRVVACKRSPKPGSSKYFRDLWRKTRFQPLLGLFAIFIPL